MSRPRTVADSVRRAAGALAGALLLLLPVPVAFADAPGLPLVPTRTIEFTTTEGTWLSLDVAPDGREIAFDLLGDLYVVDLEGGRARRLTHGLAFDSQPTWSPDGAWLAFLSDRSGAENVWIMRRDGSDARQLSSNTGPHEFISPEWSPDGRHVYASLYRADRNEAALHRYEVAGAGAGASAELSARGTNALGAAPAPDGRSIYYAARRGSLFEDHVRLPLWSVHRRDLASGRSEPVVTHAGSAMRPAVSPDGRWLAYAARQDGETELRLRNLDTGEDRLLIAPIQRDVQEGLPTRDLLPGYDFTPDSRAIVISRDGGIERVSIPDGQVTRVPFEADVAIELGPLLRQPIAEDTGPVRARLIEEPRIAADGRRAAFSAFGRIRIMELRPGAVPRMLHDRGPPQFHPAWSPDGREIAYVTWTSAGGALWIADARSGRSRRLTADDSSHFYSDVVFVPGTRSVMALRSSAAERHRTLQEPMWTGRTGGFLRQAELVEIGLDDGSVRVVTSGPLGGTAQFTRETDRVYVHGDAGLEAVARDGSWRRVVLRLLGPGYYFMEDPAPESDVRLSPDGRHALVLVGQQLYVVPVTTAAATTAIDVTAPDTPAIRISAQGADFASWADDGRTIAWALGATLYRVPLAEALAEASAGRTPAARAQALIARVEVPRATPAERWVLRGATVVTMRGDEVVRDADVLVDGNRIGAVGARGSLDVPPGTRMVDAQGRYVVPGLIDAHDHVGGIRRGVLQYDDWSLRATLAYGVTSIFDPSSLSIDMHAYADLIDAGFVFGPRLYTTGTAMFSYNRLQSLDDARDLLRRYLEHYRTRNVKQYRIGPRRDRQWVAMAAHELGVMPTAEGALDMKLGLTQVFDGYPANEHAFGTFPLRRDVVELMARSGTSSVLTLMISHGGPPAGPDFVQRHRALDDPRLARLYPDAARERSFARGPWVHRRDYVYAPMAAGAAAIQRAGGIVGIGAHGDYPGIGTHWELQAHVAGGMTAHEALRAGTLGSATAIGRAAELGSLEPGKLADFVVLDADPLADIANALRIRAVVKDGRLYDEAALVPAR